MCVGGMIIEVALVCPSSNSLGSLLEYWGFARIFGRLYGMHDTGISINNRASIAAKDFLVTECENRGLLLGGGIPAGGLGTQTVRLCPPLVITEGQVGAAIDIIEKVLSKI